MSDMRTARPLLCVGAWTCPTCGQTALQEGDRPECLACSKARFPVWWWECSYCGDDLPWGRSAVVLAVMGLPNEVICLPCAAETQVDIDNDPIATERVNLMAVKA